MALEPQDTDWKHRVLAAAFYLGLAPWLWRYCLRGEKRFLKHHFAHALTLSLLLLVIGVLYILTYAFSSYMLVNHRETYRSLSQSTLYWLLTDVLLHLLGMAWFIGWGLSMILAAAGSALEIPGLGWLSRRKAVISAAFVVCSPLYLVLLLAIGVVFHASSLTDDAVRPAAVYMLYDDLGYVPQWVYDLGFYRVSRAAARRWGKGSVVVAPLSEDALATAFENGRFVFVASHGSGGRIVTATLDYGPEDAEAVGAGADLRLVYLAACEGGEQAEAWADALDPAEIIAFPRASYLGEHVRWLWFEAPARLAQCD